MRGRSRGAIGIRREELVSVLHGVAGGRMGILVVSVVLPPLHILRGVVGLAVHRGEQRGRWTQNATHSPSTSALPTRCRVTRARHAESHFLFRPSTSLRLRRSLRVCVGGSIASYYLLS